MSVPDYTNKQGIRHADIVTCEGHWLKIQNPRTDTTNYYAQFSLLCWKKTWNVIKSTLEFCQQINISGYKMRRPDHLLF